MKKLKILLCIVLIFSMLPIGVFADEKLTSFGVSDISAVDTPNGVQVFYSNTLDGYSLYRYDSMTGISMKLNSNSSTDISAVNTPDGVVVFYSNGSDGSSLYKWEEISGYNGKLNSKISTDISAVDTPTGIQVFYSNGSDGSSLYQYDNVSGIDTKLNSFRSKDITAINGSGGLQVYYSNVDDGSMLYEYDFVFGGDILLNPYVTSDISALDNGQGGSIIYYSNGSDGSSLHSFDDLYYSDTKLNASVSQDISAVKTPDGVIHVYYSDSSDGSTLYKYDNESGVNTKLNEDNSTYISAVGTSIGSQVYYSNVLDGSSLYKYSSSTNSVEEITNVMESHDSTSVVLFWQNPQNANLEKIIVYRNGEKMEEVFAPNGQYNAFSLTPDTEYSFKLTTSYTGGIESEGVIVNVKTDPLPEVTNINHTVEHNQISLSWLEEDPYNSFAFQDIRSINIYVNGLVDQTVSKGTKTALITNLTGSTNYEIKVTVVDRFGNESEGKLINVTPPPKPIAEKPEVKDVNVESTHERVDLSWSLPESDAFRHVNIYRDNASESTASSLLDIFETRVSAADTKIFETNGTYFNDFTVQPDSSYEYTLTTTNVDNAESEGVRVQATTEPEPMPQVVNPKGEESAEGDYVLSWDEPTTGNVQIWVNGNLYDTVSAADQTYTVPSESIVVDMFGVPDVQLKAVTENGTVGNVTKVQPGANFSNVKLPFNAGQLLDTVMGLILIVGPFILLAIAIRFAPQIVRFLKDVIAKYKGGKYKL